MSLSRRKSLAIIGGGVILAATSTIGYSVTRKPQTALQPWAKAGNYEDIRKKCLSYALLSPNPHNRQPWLVDLSTKNEITLYADLQKMLPVTDPLNRQITIGLGCFLELLRMAAMEFGYTAETVLFPEGENSVQLDERPIARIRMSADNPDEPDLLFSQIMKRRSLKEPFDTNKLVKETVLTELESVVLFGSKFGASVESGFVEKYRALTHEALRIEIETPHTFKESVDLFRIGHSEVDANPDGIDFTGPLFESLRLTRVFTRETALDTSSTAYKSGLDAVFANTDTAMGYVWITTSDNSRKEQIRAGADWVRINLAATANNLGIQPLSQALQEYPEMDDIYNHVHKDLAPSGDTIQMLARIGYGPNVAGSPRWPLESKIV